ncbi:MAG: proton-conducting transporter membrane subunit, partial [Edaphobacter sp.]
MVTAGIYMVARCHTLFDRSPYALGVVAIIGAATAIFAACIGMVQHDIKRVLAYSTVSQLGYMFLACGVGAYAAGIFHLLTHAFFKALLFLAAGSVIHALGGEQDMRNMGGLRKRIPVTFWTMTAAVFAICGIYPFAGFFSKDEILYQTFISGNRFLWLVGLVAAGMTAFYMFRLWFKTFFGESRFEEASHDAHAEHSGGVHESPWVMLLPLVILAILSVIGGWVGIPQAMFGHNEIEHFLDPVFANSNAVQAAATTASHGLELALAAISMLTAAIGFYVAFLFYYKKPGTAAGLAQRAPALYRLVDNKFYVDEIYGIGIAGLLMFTRLILGGLIDGGIVNGSGKAAAAITRGLGSVTNRTQSGNIRSYAGWLALGAAAVLLVMIFGRALWMH